MITSIGLNLSEHHNHCIISTNERLKAFSLKILNVGSSHKLKATVNIKVNKTETIGSVKRLFFKVSWHCYGKENKILMLTAITKTSCAKQNFKFLFIKHIKGKHQKTRDKLSVRTQRECDH